MLRFKIILITLAIFLAMLACVSCGSQNVVVANAHERTQDSVRIEYKHDSIYIDRYHHIYTQDDTVYIYDSIWRDRWHTINKHDSIYINSTDTIYQTSTIEVEKKGSAFLRNSGIALWVLIGIFILTVIIGIILRFVKR